MGLFSDGKDASVVSQKPYREGSTLCRNLNIRSNDVSVPQFRELLGCLNSNGSIAEVQKLADRLTDEELLPIVRVGNEQFFKNATYLYRFQESFQYWVAEGWIESDLDQMGALVRNDRWLRSLLALMSKADSRLYSALQLIAQDLDAKSVRKSLEAIIALVEAPAFKSLQQRLLQPGSDALSTSELARSLLAYIQAQRAPGRVDIDRRVLKALSDGSLFRVLDDFSLTLSPGGDLREVVAKFSALSNQLSLRQSGDVKLHELMRLVNGLHAPISCLKGTQVVPNGVMFVLREIANRSTKEADHFLRRGNLLNLSMMNSFCDYPKALSRHYSALRDLSSTDTLFTAVEFSKAFYRNGSAELIVDALGGEGTGPGIHSSLMSPFEEFLPVLSELTDRGAMEDLYLLASSIRVEDRAQWQSLFAFLSKPRAELGGASVYDVLYDTILSADQDLIADLMTGFHSFMTEDGDVFASALRSMRRVLLMNDVHPILDVVTGLLSSSDQNKDFFESIFLMARKYPSEFEGAISLFGEMTRADDGRMKDILDATVRVFSKFASESQQRGEITVVEVPDLETTSMRAHSWSKQDLLKVIPQSLPEWKGCSSLSPTARLDQHEQSDYESTFNSYLECLNSDGKHSEIVVDVLGYLKGQKTSSGKPILYHLLDSVRSINLSSESIQQLVRGLFNLYDEGALFRAVDVLPWWLNREFSSTPGDAPSTVVSPLIDLAGEFARKEPDSLARVQKFAGRIIPGTAIPGALEFSRELLDQKFVAKPYTDSETFSSRPFVSPLERYECISRPSDQSRRIQSLIEDYRFSIAGDEVDSSGRPRYSWAKSELKKELVPLAKKLGDPSDGPVAERVLEFMRMMSLRDGERPSQGRLHHWSEFRDWLVVRSTDWHVIPYFYPGEESPRLKMASTLDLLELLVINSDFNFVLKENYALKFLGIMAQAWGDEPRNLWPSDIQRMYSRGRPQTLREAFNEIKDTQRLAEMFIGFPDLPDCSLGRRGQWSISLVPLEVRARVFNLSQLVGVIERNLPDANGTYRGGMRVLRNLLYQLWSSTPVANRGTDDGWKNNLSVSAKFARLGVFRQVARAVRLSVLDENQGDKGGSDLLSNVIQGLITASIQSESASAVNGLFRNDSGNSFFFQIVDFAYELFSRPTYGAEIRETILRSVAALRGTALADGLVANGNALFWRNRNEVVRSFPVLWDLLASRDVVSIVSAFEQWEPQSQADLDNRRDFDELLNEGLRAVIDGKAFSLDVLRLSTVLADSRVKSYWNRFIRSKELLESDPAYSKLAFNEMLDRFLDFLTEKDPKTALAAREVRQFIGDQLASGRVHELLLLMGRDPQGVRKLLSAVGKSSGNGELKELLRTIRRALPDPR